MMLYINIIFSLFLFVTGVNCEIFTVSCKTDKFNGPMHEFFNNCTSFCFIDLNFTSGDNIELQFNDKTPIENIEALKFSRNNILTFPKGIQNFFRHLKALIITHTELKKISSHDIEKLIDLEFLNLNYNKIEILGENLFQFNTKLKHILLKQNSVKVIDPTAFAGLSSLISLSLQNNTCFNGDYTNPRQVINDTISQCWDDKLELYKKFISYPIPINQQSNTSFQLNDWIVSKTEFIIIAISFTSLNLIILLIFLVCNNKLKKKSEQIKIEPTSHADLSVTKSENYLEMNENEYNYVPYDVKLEEELYSDIYVKNESAKEENSLTTDDVVIYAEIKKKD